MKRFVSVTILLLLSTGLLEAADEKAAPPPPPPVETQKAKEWKGLLAQEQWVARLKKQIEGEARQLSEMRGQFAEKFKLDAKKLDAGAYAYDEKKDAFVER